MHTPLLLCRGILFYVPRILLLPNFAKLLPDMPSVKIKYMYANKSNVRMRAISTEITWLHLFQYGYTGNI